MLDYSVKAHPSDVGRYSEIMILRELVRHNYQVSIPFMSMNIRYDMIVDDGEKLIRAQCKTGWFKDGKIIFNSCSVDRKGYKSYQDEADIFLVYCKENDKVYWIPVEEITSQQPYLRIDPPKNNQAKNVRWAKDYELSLLGANG